MRWKSHTSKNLDLISCCWLHFWPLSAKFFYLWACDWDMWSLKPVHVGIQHPIKKVLLLLSYKPGSKWLKSESEPRKRNWKMKAWALPQLNSSPFKERIQFSAKGEEVSPSGIILHCDKKVTKESLRVGFWQIR